MHGIYTYIPETNNVPKEYNVAAIIIIIIIIIGSGARFCPLVLQPQMDLL
jgi:hypothetical protein